MKYKKLILFLFLYLFLPHTLLKADSPVFCSSELEEIVLTAQKLPEAKVIFDTVLEGGPLFVKINRHLSKQFEGYWSAEDRTIYLTKTRGSTEGSLMSTLLFELHNAYRNQELWALTEKAGNKEICRADFIREYEYVEFKNAKDTEKLIALGQNLGIYPPCSNMSYYDDFEDHFALQQETGHSAWIGEMYDGYYSLK